MRQRRDPGLRASRAVAAFALFAIAGCGGSKASERRGGSGEEPEARRVVILIKGPRSRDVRAELTRLVGRRYQVVPAKRYIRAAHRLDATGLGESDVSRVASRIEVDAVLQGAVERRSESVFEVALRLREGTSGRTAERFGIRLERSRLSRNSRREVSRDLVRSIMKVPSVQQEKRRRQIARDEARRERSQRGRRAEQRAEAERLREAKRRRAAAQRERAEARRAEAREAERREEARRRRAASERDERRERSRRRREAKQRESERRAEAQRRRKTKERARRERMRARFEVKTDDSGQVIDDEVPSALRDE